MIWGRDELRRWSGSWPVPNGKVIITNGGCGRYIGFRPWLVRLLDRHTCRERSTSHFFLLTNVVLALWNNLSQALLSLCRSSNTPISINHGLEIAIIWCTWITCMRTLASISNVRISPFIFSIRPVQYFNLPYSQFWVSQVDFAICYFLFTGMLKSVS